MKNSSISESVEFSPSFFMTGKEAALWYTQYSSLLPHYPSEKNPKARTACLLQLAESFLFSRRYEDAEICLKSAISLAKGTRDEQSEAKAYFLQGFMLKSQQKQTEAIPLLLKAQKMLNRDEIAFWTVILAIMADAYIVMQHQVKANELIGFAEENLRFIEDPKIKSIIYRFLGRVNEVENHNAILYLERSLELANESNFYSLQIKLYSDLGWTYHRENEYRKALRYYASTFKLAMEHESLLEAALSAQNLATNYIRMGDRDNTIKYFRESDRLYTQVFGQDHPKAVNVRRYLQGVDAYLANMLTNI